MFKNILKTTIRNFARKKAYSLINITGLAIGISCCVIIFLYVQRELSYDRFHENAGRIGRVTVEYHFQGEGSEQLATPSIIGPLFQRAFSEVELSVRFYPPWRPAIVRYGQNVFQEERFYFLASYSSLPFSWAKKESWDTANFMTYLLLSTPQAQSTLKDGRQAGQTLPSGFRLFQVDQKIVRRANVDAIFVHEIIFAV